MNKRTFLKSSLLGLGSMATMSPVAKAAEVFEEWTPVGDDNDAWSQIRKQYDLPREFINLENGYYCIQPKPILDKYWEHIKYTNREGAHYMRTVQFDNKKSAATKLADLAGCTTDELIITRNTTESLDMIINGFDWKPGNEAIMAEQDYGAMLDMFRQVSKRYGTVNKFISLPFDPQSDDDIVSLYERQITSKTRLLMICHMVNITGHILPVKKVCDMAHKYGVQVMVDGAHAFAHLQFRIPELNCDYYGCSLHKWLSTPLGAGMLYIRKEHIPGIWPLFAEAGKADNDIARLNHTGTIPVAVDLTIPDAIDFYSRIGHARKEERLRYLQRYWTDKVRAKSNVVLYTPTQEHRSCAIATVGIKGMKPADLAKALMDKYRIYTVAIDNAGVHGCRITPNIYTTTDELDILVKAMIELSA